MWGFFFRGGGCCFVSRRDVPFDLLPRHYVRAGASIICSILSSRQGFLQLLLVPPVTTAPRPPPAVPFICFPARLAVFVVGSTFWRKTRGLSLTAVAMQGAITVKSRCVTSTSSKHLVFGFWRQLTESLPSPPLRSTVDPSVHHPHYQCLDSSSLPINVTYFVSTTLILNQSQSSAPSPLS